MYNLRSHKKGEETKHSTGAESNPVSSEKVESNYVALSDDLGLPRFDYDFMVAKAQTLHSVQFHKSLARLMFDYFFGNERDEFWSESTSNSEYKRKLADTRRVVHEFVLRETGFPTRRYLEDYCCQRRKYVKQKFERRNNESICAKCERSCKGKRDKLNHEKKCFRRHPLKTPELRSRTREVGLITKRSKDVLRKAISSYQKGLEARVVNNKSRGVFTKRKFQSKEYVCVYPGQLITHEEAKNLEEVYTREGKGCYLFFFEYKTKRLCYDATAEGLELGRLINHSTNDKNIAPKIMDVNGKPKIVFFAVRTIERGEELLYEYGERRKEVKSQFSWL